MMKSLQTIQKTFRVFQILAKIAFVFSIVGASICAVGALCAVTWYSGGTVFTLFGEPVPIFAGGEGLNQTLAVLLSDLIMLTAEPSCCPMPAGISKPNRQRVLPLRKTAQICSKGWAFAASICLSWRLWSHPSSRFVWARREAAMSVIFPVWPLESF